MNKVVVTGASGHIGYHVAKLLFNRFKEVHLLVRRKSPNIVELERMGATVHSVDLYEASTFAHILRDADCLYHMAAENNADSSQKEKILKGLIDLSRSVITTAIESKVKTIVYTSSGVVMGRTKDPSKLVDEFTQNTFYQNPYCEGKIQVDQWCDQLVDQQEVDIRRLYPSWVMGGNAYKMTPMQEVVYKFIQGGQKFAIHAGVSIANVDEVAKAHVEILDPKHHQGKFVLGGDNVTLKELYELLSPLTGKEAPKLVIPSALLKLGFGFLAFLDKWLPFRLPIDVKYARSIIDSYSWFDSNKAQKELGYRIPKATETLKAAVDCETLRFRRLDALGRTRYTKIEYESRERPPLLLTGVPGRLGNRFVDLLINGNGDQIKASNRKVKIIAERQHAHLLNLPQNFEVIPGDIREPDTVRKALEHVETVYHLAAIISTPNVSLLHDVNFNGTKNLVDRCIELGVRRFVHMSTDAVAGYGTKDHRIFSDQVDPNPYGPYGYSKWLAEDYVLRKSREGAIDGTAIRAFWIFGPFGDDTQKAWFQRKNAIVFGDGNNYRSISHSDNIFHAFAQCENQPNSFHNWYWIGESKSNYTQNQMHTILAQAFGVAYHPIKFPAMICDSIRFFNRYFTKTGFQIWALDSISKLNLDIAGSIDRAKQDFNYNPIMSIESEPRGYFPPGE